MKVPGNQLARKRLGVQAPVDSPAPVPTPERVSIGDS